MGKPKKVMAKRKQYPSGGSLLMSRFSGGGGKELKFLDTNVNFTVDATPEVPATGQLALIPQDTTPSGRVGRKVTVKSVQLSGILQYVPGADTSGGTMVTLALVQDTQCNGAAATATSVMGLPNTTLPNIQYTSRFRILKKWRIEMNSSAGVSGAYAGCLKSVDGYKKVNIPLDYIGATGAISEIRSNNIFLIASTDGYVTRSDDVVTFDGTARIRYFD